MREDESNQVKKKSNWIQMLRHMRTTPKTISLVDIHVVWADQDPEVASGLMNRESYRNEGCLRLPRFFALSLSGCSSVRSRATHIRCLTA
jgi:hypothetical protein